MKLLLIYNPAAGGGKAKKFINPMMQYFVQKGFNVVLKLTTCKRHATQLTQEADFSQYQGVVASGGDGTLFEVVNGYLRNTSLQDIYAKKPPLGIVPNGTGNAFSKELGLTGVCWQKAIDIIALNHRKKIDVGVFRTENEVHYFLNMLGFGFVSEVNKASIRLKFLGPYAYFLAVFQRLLGLKTYQLQLTIDNQLVERDNVFLEVANSRYTGDNFLMAPDAQIDDGYLDLVLLNKASRTKILKLFPTIFTGKHVDYPEIEVFKAKKIRIQTVPPQILTPDGELFGKTPVEIDCISKALEVFWR